MPDSTAVRPIHLTSRDFVVMPWKNGQGETTEIARHPAGGRDLDGFDWRLSLAPVLADGAFSMFPGVTRTIVVLEGAGMRLRLGDGREHELRPLATFTFDGGVPVDGRLVAGPVRDFNLMVRRGRWSGQLELVEGAVRVSASGEKGLWIGYAASGAWRLPSSSGSIAVTAGEGFRLDGPGPLAVEPAAAPARLLLARLDPL